MIYFINRGQNYKESLKDDLRGEKLLLCITNNPPKGGQAQ